MSDCEIKAILILPDFICSNSGHFIPWCSYRTECTVARISFFELLMLLILSPPPLCHFLFTIVLLILWFLIMCFIVISTLGVWIEYLVSLWNITFGGGKRDGHFMINRNRCILCVRVWDVQSHNEHTSKRQTQISHWDSDPINYCIGKGHSNN